LPVHLNATNIQELLEPAGGRTVAETIDNNLRAVEEQARRTGKEILVHLNHPNFGLAVTAEDMASILRERYFEVYNGHPGVKHLGDKDHPSVERMWDIANTIRLGKLKYAPLFGVATDDSHNYHNSEGATPGRGWIMVRAANLDPETLIKAIRAGDSYSSSGVTLDEVEFDPKTNTLKLTVQPDADAEFTTQFIGTRVGYDDRREPHIDANGNPVREQITDKYSDDVGRVLAIVKGLTPSYKLKGDELYVRAVVSSNKAPINPAFDNQKQQAWTQPVGWVEYLDATKAKPEPFSVPR
jgi:hypothetical protein